MKGLFLGRAEYEVHVACAPLFRLMTHDAGIRVMDDLDCERIEHFTRTEKNGEDRV